MLTLREPAHEDLLRSLPSDIDIAVARRAVKNLWAWRNKFSISRRTRSGLFGSHGRLDRHGAERALADALAALNGGDL